MHIRAAALNLEDYLDGDTPAFMSGPPGVGKSAIVQQITRKRGWGMVDFRASTRDSVALMGLPDISGNTTRWKVPDEFPQVERDGAEGILFLDELNAAPPSMMAAMFGLVLDRKVGEYVLPPGWRVVAAGNRQSDRAAAQRMPTTLANRFAHIEVDADLSGNSLGEDNVHVAYFIEIGIDPTLISFLRFRPELIHKMPEHPEQKASPTPRSWEQAAKYVNKDPARRLSLITGLVGEGAAGELEGFIRVVKNLPSLDLVLSNPNNAPLPTDVSARYAIASGLARKVDHRTIGNAYAYMKRMPARDFTIMFMVDAVRRDTALSHTQTFIDFSAENQDVIIG